LPSSIFQNACPSSTEGPGTNQEGAGVEPQLIYMHNSGHQGSLDGPPAHTQNLSTPDLMPQAHGSHCYFCLYSEWHPLWLQSTGRKWTM